MIDPRVLVILVGIACIYYVSKPVVHAVKKTAHGVVHVVTLGKK